MELGRKHGVSDATFYIWCSKYGGMEVSDTRRLKTLQSESSQLTKMLAEELIDDATLKEMLGKSIVRPAVASLWDDILGLHKCMRPLISG